MADEEEEEGEDRVIYHPNRDSASAKATKSIVILLLIVSAALTLIITAGGWASMQGGRFVCIIYILLFLFIAWYVNKWVRGVLPLIAGLAVVLGVFAAIAVFGTGNWFERDQTGYDTVGQLPPSLVGLLCLVLLPVLLLLIAFSMRAFSQKWNIEIEMSREEYEEKYRGGGRRGGGGGYGGRSQPAEG